MIKNSIFKSREAVRKRSFSKLTYISFITFIFCHSVQGADCKTTLECSTRIVDTATGLVEQNKSLQAQINDLQRKIAELESRLNSTTFVKHVGAVPFTDLVVKNASCNNSDSTSISCVAAVSAYCESEQKMNGGVIKNSQDRDHLDITCFK